jgi:hypothetical protein
LNHAATVRCFAGTAIWHGKAPLAALALVADRSGIGSIILREIEPNFL